MSGPSDESLAAADEFMRMLAVRALQENDQVGEVRYSIASWIQHFESEHFHRGWDACLARHKITEKH